MQMPGMKPVIPLVLIRASMDSSQHIGRGVTITYRGASPGQASGSTVKGSLYQLDLQTCRSEEEAETHRNSEHRFHPQAMTFPSCRGSAYVTAESATDQKAVKMEEWKRQLPRLRGLKPFVSSDLPLAVGAPRCRLHCSLHCSLHSEV